MSTARAGTPLEMERQGGLGGSGEGAAASCWRKFDDVPSVCGLRAVGSDVLSPDSRWGPGRQSRMETSGCRRWSDGGPCAKGMRGERRAAGRVAALPRCGHISPACIQVMREGVLSETGQGHPICRVAYREALPQVAVSNPLSALMHTRGIARACAGWQQQTRVPSAVGRSTGTTAWAAAEKLGRL